MLYEQKEIARLRRELRDAQDALDVLKKASEKENTCASYHFFTGHMPY